MSHLRTGELVEARIVGFLPARRVVLDIGGEPFLAWSDLPLVRGDTVRAVVEVAGPGLRLRVVREPSEVGAATLRRTLERSGIEVDDLDLMIAEAARELGIRVGPELVVGVRDQLNLLDVGLGRGAVPLGRLKRETRTLLALWVRGVPPSSRVRRALSVGRDARLGTVLSRLVESLESAGASVRGTVGAALRGHAERLRTYFLEVAVVEGPADLRRALDRCGYTHETKSAATGVSNWDSENGPRDDLKGRLLWLWPSLAEVREVIQGRWNPAVRRGLERSLAWCGRAIELIEGIQILNLPAGPLAEVDSGSTFQLPVRIPAGAGTLILSFSDQGARFWLEPIEGEALGAEMVTAADRVEIALFLPERVRRRLEGREDAWLEVLSDRMRPASKDVRLRLVHEAPRPVEGALGPRSQPREVDLVL